MQLVKECNETARSMERMEELLILSQQLDFKEVRRAVPLISASRWLVKRLEKVTRISWKEGAADGSVTVAKLTFGRRVNRQSLCLFLFTDMLVITKRKRFVSSLACATENVGGTNAPMALLSYFSDENYLVVDHCPRNLVTLAELDSTDGGILGVGKNLSDGSMAWLTLLQNHENKTVEWLISFR